MKFIARIFLLMSFVYTGYYTIKDNWIRDYMYFGICPALPLLLLITQLQNFINVMCSCKCCWYIQFLFTFIIYLSNYISYSQKLCYDEYDKTIPELIDCFEFNILMQTIYVLLCLFC